MVGRMLDACYTAHTRWDRRTDDMTEHAINALIFNFGLPILASFLTLPLAWYVLGHQLAWAFNSVAAVNATAWCAMAIIYVGHRRMKRY